MSKPVAHDLRACLASGLTLAVIAAWGPLGGVTSAFAQARPTAVAVDLGGASIAVDGRLDDAAWARAPVNGGFVERSPTPRATPPVDTRFRVLFDRDAIYVAVEMDLLEGETPRALALSRDSFDIYSDDAITLKIDVARDRRTTLGFAVNPANTQLDYVAVENGAQMRREFDAVWESATTIRSDAWVAEFRIPVAALGLPPEDGDRVLGFNVTRDHNRRFATDDWAHLPPEFGAFAALHYGDLVGLAGLAGGHSLQIIPYLAVTVPDDRATWEPLAAEAVALRAGADLRLRIASDVWSELTVLTDFAQIDLDDQIVNLDRFSLFLPESRPFFLTGLDLFELGERGEAQLFFSRRIGLDDAGNERPLYSGLKVYGHEGAIGFGLLDVMTGTPTENLAVSRVRVNFSDHANVGIMTTTRNDIESRDASYGVGLDAALRGLDDRLELTGAWAAATDGELVVENRMLGQARLRYQGEHLQPSLRGLYVEDHFDPGLGFVQRQGIARTQATLPVVLRTHELGLDSVTLTGDGTLDLDDELRARLGSRSEGSLALSWPAVEVSATLGHGEDVVEDPFTLAGRATIPVGRYQGVRARYSLSASSQRNPYGTISYEARSGFFGGFLHGVDVSTGVAFGAHLKLSLGAALAFIDLPAQAPLRTATVNTVLAIAPSTVWGVDLIFQLNSADETTIGLARLRYRYLPGSDIFLVYRQDVDYQGHYHGRTTLKLTYWWDAML